MSIRRASSILFLMCTAVGAGGCELGQTSTVTSPFSTNTLFEPAQIQGSWTSACVAASPATGMSTHSIKEILTFAGATLTITDLTYSDSLCQTIYITAQQVASFTLGDKVPTNSLSRTLDFSSTYVHYTPNSAQAVTDLNAISLCGLSGWSSGTERDITGRTCNGSPTPAANANYYSIVEVLSAADAFGSLPGLYLGYGVSTSAATRPTSLSGNRYQRQ